MALLVGTMVLGDFRGDWRPTHFDEWRSLAMAQRALNEGTLAREEPVGSPNGLARDISDRNRSLGFVALVVAWRWAAPEPIAHYKFLALALLGLYMLGIYVLCRKLGVRHWAALPAVLALGTLPTDTMLLGPALAVPSSLGLGLLCFALSAHLQLSEANSDRRGRWSGVLILATGLLATVYPLALIVFGGFLVVDSSARPEILRTRYMRIVAGLSLVGAAVFLLTEWQGNPGATGRHLAALFWLDQRWHLVGRIVYTLDYLITPPLLVLAMLGAVLSLAKRNRIWTAATFLGPLLALGLYHVSGSGLVVPYQRLGLFLGLGASLCSGIALERILAAAGARGFSKWPQVLLVGTVSLLFILTPRPSPPFKRTTRIDRPTPVLEELSVRISERYSSPARIHSAPGDAMYLEALTGLRVAPEVLDVLLTGRAPPRLVCDAGWEIVVGDCHCPNYEVEFQIAGVPVCTPIESQDP